MKERYQYLIGRDTTDGDYVEKYDVLDAVAETWPDTGANVEETDGTWKGRVESGAYRVTHVDMHDEMTRRDAMAVRQKFEELFDQDTVLTMIDEVETV